MDAAQILSVSVPLSAAYIAQKWFTHLSHRARSAPAAPVVVREMDAPAVAERAGRVSPEQALSGLSGAEVGLLLGVSERTGRRILAGMRSGQNGDGHDAA